MEDYTIAIIGVASAFASACMALVSWWYNRELSRATLSVVKVEMIHHRRVKKDALRLDFLWTFKNVGKETLKITHDRFGFIDFERRAFQEIPERPMLNPVHSGGSFGILLPLRAYIDPQTPDEDIPDILPKIRKHALILRLKYKGTSVFSWGEASLTHYVGFEGHKEVYQLSEEEYREIEEHLPQEFRASQ